MAYDVIIREGLWFDGTGGAPRTRTLGIRAALVACVVSDDPALTQPCDLAPEP